MEEFEGKEKPANLLENKPGELKVGRDKYNVLPNQEVQATSPGSGRA